MDDGFNCLLSRSLKVSFLQVLYYRCHIVAEGCYGGLLPRPKERCEHSLHLDKLIHYLLVDWCRLGHYTGTGSAADGWLVFCIRVDAGLHTVSMCGHCHGLRLH